MGRKKTSFKLKLPNFWRRNRKKIISIFLTLFFSLSAILFNWLWQLRAELKLNAAKPFDAIFVLGGSINREIHIAKIAKKYPQIPILISQGSKDPCILLIFLREQVSSDRVWLEKCAKNTFGNFVFSVPILANWGVHHVKLITSKTHLPRSKYMAQIFFGMRGIWVDVGLAPEKGVPGNRESPLKTFFDVTRSIIWCFFSHSDTSECENIINLKNVNLYAWVQQGFHCERQAKLDGIIKMLLKTYGRE